MKNSDSEIPFSKCLFLPFASLLTALPAPVLIWVCKFVHAHCCTDLAPAVVLLLNRWHPEDCAPPQPKREMVTPCWWRSPAPTTNKSTTRRRLLAAWGFPAHRFRVIWPVHANSTSCRCASLPPASVRKALNWRCGSVSPSLKEAVVALAFSLQPEPLRKTIGRACAAYLAQVIRPGMRICIGSGRTLYEAIEWISPARCPTCRLCRPWAASATKR